jgi:hypothetical protein
MESIVVEDIIFIDHYPYVYAQPREIRFNYPQTNVARYYWVVEYNYEDWRIIYQCATGNNSYWSASSTVTIQRDEISKEEHESLKKDFVKLWKIASQLQEKIDLAKIKHVELEAINEITKIVDSPIDNILLNEDEEE